jgi:hypothetical protein
MHKGNANSGHYYCNILGKRVDDEEISDLNEQKGSSSAGNDYLIFYFMNGLSKISHSTPFIREVVADRKSLKAKSAFTATSIVISETSSLQSIRRN